MGDIIIYWMFYDNRLCYYEQNFWSVKNFRNDMSGDGYIILYNGSDFYISISCKV